MNTLNEDLKFALNECLRQLEVMLAAECLKVQEYNDLKTHFFELLRQWEAGLLNEEYYLEPAKSVEDAKQEIERGHRVLSMLRQQLIRQQERQLLSEDSLRSCLQGIDRQIDKLRLELGEDVESEPASESAAQPQEEKPIDEVEILEDSELDNSVPKRSIIERLLDPEALNRMMSVGGVLLTSGLVLWLWSIGLFDHPLIAACVLGGVNLSVIVAGVGLVTKTRHEMAGHGLTMLGCLILPLNLWFYDAQGLITLDEGGHLWIPALGCCVIYAFIAGILKRSHYVYPLVGGITLTGLMILGDQRIGRFYEIIAPSTLMAVIGVSCIFIERLFPQTDQPFRRETFGKAFYLAGHAVLGSSLALLFSGRIAGHFYDTLLAHRDWFEKPDVVTSMRTQAMALGITLTATWTYFLSSFRTAQSRLLLSAACFTFCWSSVIVFDMTGIEVTRDLLLFLLSVGAFSLQTSGVFLGNQQRDPKTPITVPEYIGCVLNVLLMVAWGMIILGKPAMTWFELDTYAQIAGMTLCIGGMSLTRYSVRETPLAEKTGFLSWCAGISWNLLTLHVCLLAGMSDQLAIFVSIWLLAAIQTAVVVARNSAASYYIRLNSFTAVFPTIALLSEMLVSGNSEFTLDLACLLGLAVFNGLTAQLTRSGISYIASFLFSWLMLIRIGVHFELPRETHLIIGTLLGLGVATLGRYLQQTKSFFSLNNVGFGVMMLSGAAGVLIGISQVLVDDSTLLMSTVLGIQALSSGLGILTISKPEMKVGMRFLIAFQVASSIIMLVSMSQLTISQRFELGATVVGLLTLATGLVAWSKERSGAQSEVSLMLTGGSLLSVVPMTIGLIAQRINGYGEETVIALIHQYGLLVIVLGMIGCGVLCKLRSVTLTGAAGFATYMTSLIILIRLPEQLQSISVVIMVGGGVFFVTALMLSIYRDRLLTLPQRVRDGEGVYQVLKWR